MAPMPCRAKKSSHCVRTCAQLPMTRSARGRPLSSSASVPLGDDAAVEQDHDAHVLPAPDQAAESLLQLERRVRQQVVHESVLSLLRQPLESRGRERLATAP